MTHSSAPPWAWLVLAAVLVGSVVIDLWLHRGGRGQSRRTAVLWSVVWIALALGFAGGVWASMGADAAEDFVTAYAIEKSLSIDNLFVFLVIFSRLRVPRSEQHRVLTWGVGGALVTRAVFIASGAALLEAWHGIVYVLGAFLVFTGAKTAFERNDASEGEGWLLSFVRRHVPFTPRFDGHRFLTVENGRRLATPLLLAVLVVEATDVLFAIDSIPAVFAISRDPFIVYASNVFAIIGLRALYLVLADLLRDLEYLRYGLGAILVLAGAKMLTADLFDVPHVVSLGAVVLVLACAIVPSVVVRRQRSSSAP